MCIRTSKTSETADITQTDRLKDGFSPGLGSGQGGQPGHGQPGGGGGGERVADRCQRAGNKKRISQ